MSKHSRGPWRAGTPGGAIGTGYYCIPVWDAEETEWKGPGEICSVGRNNLEEAKANARLIAAAPEMLNALINVAIHFRMFEPITDGEKAIHDEVIAVLKKVEGK